MFPWSPEFAWDAYHVAFFGALYAVLATVAGSLALAVWRARRDAREGRAAAIAWHGDFAEMPASAQGKLLRVLEDHEVKRLGSTSARLVDVRVISASCPSGTRSATPSRPTTASWARTAQPTPAPTRRSCPSCRT